MGAANLIATAALLAMILFAIARRRRTDAARQLRAAELMQAFLRSPNQQTVRAQTETFGGRTAALIHDDADADRPGIAAPGSRERDLAAVVVGGEDHQSDRVPWYMGL